ncbi:hypothetical protein PRZ48_007339 [Zasmidium cellare]|uniref:Uncharacterized protein n=1 Tax=Zasmidium cellare TaxID=395010 RepID=A0ABR0EJ62_ZASCE|nr:hypothetical protein PRZ48_007339 [Zasmidium cellare]
MARSSKSSKSPKSPKSAKSAKSANRPVPRMNWLKQTEPKTESHEKRMAAVRRSKSDHDSATAHQKHINKSKIGALIAHLSAEVGSMPKGEVKEDRSCLPVPDIDLTIPYSDEEKLLHREYFLKQDKRFFLEQDRRFIAAQLADEDPAPDAPDRAWVRAQVEERLRKSERKAEERKEKWSNASELDIVALLHSSPVKEQKCQYTEKDLSWSEQDQRQMLLRWPFSSRYFWENRGIMASVFGGVDKEDSLSPASSTSPDDSPVRRSGRVSRPSARVIENITPPDFSGNGHGATPLAGKGCPQISKTSPRDKGARKVLDGLEGGSEMEKDAQTCKEV